MYNCTRCKKKTNDNIWKGDDGITYVLCENCELTMDVETDLENTQYSEDQIICPYCYYSEWLDYNDIDNEIDDEKYECESCGKEFFISAEQTVNLTTSCIVSDQDIKEEVERRKKKLKE